jgi:hypothetical protein
MPAICLVCNSPKRKQIDAAIVEAKESKRGIARRFGVGGESLRRHSLNCIPAKVSAVLREEGITLATRTKEMARRVGEVFAKLDEAREGDPCPTCGAKALTTQAALDSGFLAMKLKAVDSLGKVAELEFGTKSKVTTTVDPRAEWAALSPAEKRERLAEMKHRVLELEQETATGSH